MDTTTHLPSTFAGALLWARYSYPPNELGYCGPTDHRLLFDYGTAQTVDDGLRQHLRGFEGAYPYMELIAGVTGVGDPFDQRVVEAYWVGNSLLDRIGMRALGEHLWERFRHRAGVHWEYLAEAIPAGALPHHNFHVLAVYPWVRRLWDADHSGVALQMLDRCRIRWGQVVAAEGDLAVVRSRPLVWDGKALGLGEAANETVTRAVAGSGFVDIAPGDWVSAHWGWLCDRLTTRQLANLRHYTATQLDMINRKVAHSGPRMRLDRDEREY